MSTYLNGGANLYNVFRMVRVAVAMLPPPRAWRSCTLTAPRRRCTNPLLAALVLRHRCLLLAGGSRIPAPAA